MTSTRRSFRLLPIKQVHVYREVFTQLDKLVSGLRPGERLSSERELAERLGVSRVSVREALRALESMGKIEIRRNAGAFVLDPEGTLPVEHLLGGLEPSLESLQWLTDLRAAIETRVVQLLAARPDADLGPAAEFLERAAAELDDQDTEQGSLDLRFEAILARAAGNPMLERTQKWVHQAWVTAWGEYGRAPGDRRTLHAEHLAILAALRGDDGGADGSRAMRLMEAHVDCHVRTTREEGERP
ncbi:FadR/GntR family transcriptional regulator [Pseudonocardia acaciae]|uniref:FadR/GntR family transcriptional regulator n=1 Tax=Pseudonocardia acaciae TaxID=551276 RepID=UPI000686AF6F|nr:FCD domain-containing protein [Pseudonocardia acaciae]